MRAGSLFDNITIKRPDVSTNDVGEQITTYSVVKTIRCHTMTRRNNRENAEGNIIYPNTLTIEVRRFQDIQDYDLIIHRGKPYRILSIEYDRQMQCKRLQLEETTPIEETTPTNE